MAELVLVVGTYRPAVTAVRALARRGRRVVVGREHRRRHREGSAGIELSRYTSAVWDHPSISGEPDAFLDALVHELASRPEPVHVLPLDEEALTLLAGERSRLPANASLATPASETVITCLDKQRCLDAAGTAGLAVPPWEVVRDHRELLAAAGRVPAPAVVKPLWPRSRLLTDRKVVRYVDPDDLARQMPTWPSGHDRLLVQQFAEGARHDLLFAARDGELLDVVQKLTTRTQRRDGTGLAVAGHTCPVQPRLAEQLRALAAQLRYTGVGFAQFLVPSGAPDGAFIELNPRISGSNVIAERAGLDLANLAVDLAADLPVQVRGPAARRAGHSYAWTFGDLSGLWYSVLQREVTPADALAEFGRIARAGLRADVHTTWSWRDPAPTVATYWRYLVVASLRVSADRGRARLQRSAG